MKIKEKENGRKWLEIVRRLEERAREQDEWIEDSIFLVSKDKVISALIYRLL